ncbi:MAG TPA: PIG-L family deacetylase [Methanobacterium sp.]|nr:PIG-L family deacetylase [Methanobacterium sp.]
MFKKKYYLSLILLIVCACLVSLSSIDYPANSVINNSTPIINPQDRVMVIAPHPDDESIACAGVIHYCTEKNIPVTVVVLTDGYLSADPVTRHNETVSAMDLLGVKNENIIFLGYKDGTLPSLLNRYWDPSDPYNINGSINNGNYLFSFENNTTYCGANLYDNLVEIVNNFQPTVVFYPDSEDEQIDHWAANGMTEYVLAKTNYQGAKYTYIVHDPPDWPSPRSYNPEDDLTPPPELTKIGYKWVSFPLDGYQERLKEAALNLYPSQINNISYIRSFIRTNELFGVNPEDQVNISQSNPSNMTTVILEPMKHDEGRGSVRTREITSVDFSLDNQSAQLEINTRHNISMTTNYEVHMLFLGGSNVGRIDLKINNGTLYYQNFTGDSYQKEPQNVDIEGNVMKLKIPSSAFNNVNSFLISSDIISGNTLIDWTAWRTVEIES